MLASVLENSRALSLSEYETIIRHVIHDKDNKEYAVDMHPYIEKNNQLGSYIQSNITINKKFFNAIQKSVFSSIHLITEPWCLDACIILPLLRGITIIKPDIEIKIYPRDKNEDLMNLFLTNGSKSIPIVFALDENQTEVFRWGPRSQKAKEILEPIKEENYGVKSKALSDFYKSELTENIQLEWLDLIK
ncbi:MAG: thioredoxin family protein [Chitinophagales bacterium]|nr:thioredoxin family protein [Chitinophagales bacterium]